MADPDTEADLEEGLPILAVEPADGADWLDVIDPRRPDRVRRAPAAYVELA